MEASRRTPKTNSVADSPTRGGSGAMEDTAAPGPPVGGGVPYNPYPLAGSGSAGYVGYYMGPPYGTGNGGGPHGSGYGIPYGGPMGPIGAAGVIPPSPHHAYAMQSRPQASYGSRGVHGPPGGLAPSGMASQYGRGFSIYEYYGAGSRGQPMKPPQQSPPQQSMQGERASPSSPTSKFHEGSPRSNKDGPPSKSSPLAAESRTDESSPLRATSSNNAGDSDVDRAKSVAEEELAPSLVKPLQSYFHFFVLAVKDRLYIEAEMEVQSSLNDSSKVAPDSQQLQYLINANLNARLMKEWEDMKLENKEAYLKKEEEDRKRFMEEDEVASRHCATLTARVKSPGDVGGGSKESSPGRRKESGKDKLLKTEQDGGDESESDGEDDPDLQLQATESQDGGNDDDEVTTEREPKRSPGEPSRDDQSPSKKNRPDEDKSDDPR
jgi:hypothetical protein